MLRYSPAIVAILLLARSAAANDLSQLYELALTRDATLQAATFQRDAGIETRPQALAQLLPQLSASASAERERQTYESAQIAGSIDTINCVPYAAGSMQRCFGDTRGVALNLTQVLWSYQAFSQLKEANFQAAAAEATLMGAQQNLLLRVAQAYFMILSAAD